MEMPILKFKLIDPNVVLPAYAHAHDSGMDVCSTWNGDILPHSFVLIPTGLVAEIPDGYEIQVRPRSGLQCKRGIVCAWGTVDTDYHGEIKVALYNHSDTAYTVNKGDRIAQFVLAPVVRANVVRVDEINTNTDRGDGGFGSTGK